MGIFYCVLLLSVIAVGLCARDFTFINGNASCTIVNVTSQSNLEDYSFLTKTIDELIFDKANIEVLDLTKPLSIATPWKLLISYSNVTRILFPGQMSPSVVHLMHTEVEDVQFDENTSLQDFRADYTSLEVVSPTVSKLQSLDVLWITHSQLRNFSFDVLENSPVSLLYLVGNKIESITISPGLVCCRNLEEIFLSDNHLKLLDFGTIALMSKLKAMFVEQNRLTDGVLNIPGMDQNQMLITAKGDTFCSWRRYYIEQDLNQEVQTPNCTDYFATLLAVHLSRNRFEHINFSIFSLMNSLNSLDLSKNQLVDMIATEDQVPVRLSELFGSNNNISELYLSPLLSMKAIYLLDNNLKTLNMSNLPRDLDYLNLINNPLNCNELPHMNKSTIIPLLGPYTEC